MSLVSWGCSERFFFSSRRRHTRFKCDWSSDVCSSDLYTRMLAVLQKEGHKAPRYLDLRKKISAELMQIRFAARQVERLCDSVRYEVDKIGRASCRERV